MSAKQELGFIGVGRMGIHMAGRLLEAGYGVTVYDLNETNVARLVQRGAKRAGSPAEVASAAETVLASLPTPDIVKSVAANVATGSKVKTFIDLSTTGPVVAKEVAAALAAKGIAAVGDKAQFSALTNQFLGLVAANRRLSALPAMAASVSMRGSGTATSPTLGSMVQKG